MSRITTLGVIAFRMAVATDWKDLAHRLCVRAGAHRITPRRKP